MIKLLNVEGQLRTTMIRTLADVVERHPEEKPLDRA